MTDLRSRGAKLAAAALALLLAAGLLAACGGDDDAPESGQVPGEADGPPEFGYSGETGPANWAELDPAYHDCAGERQSPIDLADAEPAELPRIRFAYEPAEVEVENNGHSVEATYPPGSSIELDGTEYALQQFHYHAPSEHHINGRAAKMELHFVHESADRELVVVAALVEEGEENAAFAALVETLPRAEGETAQAPGEVDALELLPPGAAASGAAERWSYEGSLTTPPCTEGVAWHVLAQPVELSAEQIAAYTDVYTGNDRPLQPLGERRLLTAR